MLIKEWFFRQAIIFKNVTCFFLLLTPVILAYNYFINNSCHYTCYIKQRKQCWFFSLCIWFELESNIWKKSGQEQDNIFLFLKKKMFFFQDIRKRTHNFCKSFFFEIMIFQFFTFFYKIIFAHLKMKTFLKQSHQF